MKGPSAPKIPIGGYPRTITFKGPKKIMKATPKKLSTKRV